MGGPGSGRRSMQHAAVQRGARLVLHDDTQAAQHAAGTCGAHRTGTVLEDAALGEPAAGGVTLDRRADGAEQLERLATLHRQALQG